MYTYRIGQCCYYTDINWLVVSTPLKNISQLGSLFPMYGKIKMFFFTLGNPGLGWCTQR